MVLSIVDGSEGMWDWDYGNSRSPYGREKGNLAVADLSPEYAQTMIEIRAKEAAEGNIQRVTGERPNLESATYEPLGSFGVSVFTTPENQAYIIAHEGRTKLKLQAAITLQETKGYTLKQKEILKEGEDGLAIAIMNLENGGKE